MNDSTRLGLPINVRLVLRASDGGSTDAVVFAPWLVPDVRCGSTLSVSQRSKKQRLMWVNSLVRRLP
jgi:hypothetical protein